LAHLHVGATHPDWSRWKSHVGHEFYYHCAEDKDLPRVLEDTGSDIKMMLADMTLPSISVDRGSTVVGFSGVKDMLKLADLADRKRIHFELPDRRYGVLHFPDCLYDMSEDQFSDYWTKTGAMVGYAVMFFPDKFINEFACNSELYNYREYIGFQEKTEDLLEAVWPSIALLAPLLPTHFIGEQFHGFLGKVFDGIGDRLKEWACTILHDDFPLEAAAAIGFEAWKMDRFSFS